MKTIVPDYYPRFSCLMGTCRHTCCAGWEIDIDDLSHARFAGIQGDMGTRIRENMTEEGGVHSFRLREDGRCPFLRDDGLCDMIVHLGKDSLCQICADHPRFRNPFSDHTEMGLGLCCEAAARLILTDPDPVRLIELENDGETLPPDTEEQTLLSLRDKWMRIATDRTQSFAERFQLLENELLFPFSVPSLSMVPFLLSLERLDDVWAEQLDLLTRYTPVPLPEEMDTAFEQLLVYLLYRHLPAAMQDGDADGKLCYSLFICRLIMDILGCRMASAGHVTLEDMCELCRMYSCEIEYSDENLDAVMNALCMY